MRDCVRYLIHLARSLGILFSACAETSDIQFLSWMNSIYDAEYFLVFVLVLG
jgi:hypothetical protein